MSLYVWAQAYKLESNHIFELFPYKAQSPITRKYREFKNEADVWYEVDAISELAETSKTRTMGQLLYDLVPLFASPSLLFEDWMVDIMNEYHWIKNWNVSPGNLDDISARRLDCWSIIENELAQIKKYETEKSKNRE